MSRFSRLVELRRIREESYGMAYAHILAKVEHVQQNMVKLDEITEKECMAARQVLGQGGGQDGSQGGVWPSGSMVEDFLKGQFWRRKKLEEKMATLQKEQDKAKDVWLTARVQLKQAEKLVEKDVLQQHHKVEKRERKMMDMIGIIQNQPLFEQKGGF